MREQNGKKKKRTRARVLVAQVGHHLARIVLAQEDGIWIRVLGHDYREGGCFRGVNAIEMKE